MRSALFSFAILIALGLSTAVRADDIPPPGSSGTTFSSGQLVDETTGLKPVIGAISYSDILGSRTARLAEGLVADFNLLGMLLPVFEDTYIGISTGLVFSHLGSATSNFLGSNPAGVFSDTGANLFQIPLDLKIGVNSPSNVRFSVRVGANLFYRSTTNAVNLDSGSNVADASLAIAPNIGADYEIGFARKLSILIRPDLTFAPSSVVLGGLIGIGISLG